MNNTRNSGNPIKERAKVRGREHAATGGSHECRAYLVPADPRWLAAMTVPGCSPMRSKCSQCGTPYALDPRP